MEKRYMLTTDLEVYEINSRYINGFLAINPEVNNFSKSNSINIDLSKESKQPAAILEEVGKVEERYVSKEQLTSIACKVLGKNLKK